MSTDSEREIPFGRPQLGEQERAAVAAVLSGPILTHGPKGAEFEDVFARFTSAAHAVTTSNCTTALHLALWALGVRSGDEVIVPAMTHVASAHAAEHCGAKPVFVDVDSATGNINPELVAAAVTARTKAIMVVHFVGLPCDMTALMSLADSRGLPVVEDCAAALGAGFGGRHVGTFGRAGCFSFYPTKHITTMEGGMLVSGDAPLAARVRKLRAFGYNKALNERTVPGVYDVDALGHNFRMSEGAAAIGVCQMARLPQFLETRARNAATLREGLSTLPGLRVLPARHGPACSSNFCVNVVLPDGGPDRDEFLMSLQRDGVGTSVHYPVALPLSAYYRGKYGWQAEQFPEASRMARQSLSLPCAPHVGERDCQRILETFSQHYRRQGES